MNYETPAEAGRRLAQQAPPLTPEQIEGIARILLSVELERQAEERATKDGLG